MRDSKESEWTKFMFAMILSRFGLRFKAERVHLLVDRGTGGPNLETCSSKQSHVVT